MTTTSKNHESGLTYTQVPDIDFDWNMQLIYMVLYQVCKPLAIFILVYLSHVKTLEWPLDIRFQNLDLKKKGKSKEEMWNKVKSCS